jgi:ribonucrease Y
MGPELFVGLGIGIVIGVGGCIAYWMITQRGAKLTAQAIVDESKRNAESLIKEAEFKIKEVEFERKTEMEHQLNEHREQMRKRERELDVRENSLNQQLDQQRKQEKMIEATQQRLKAKVEAANSREKELEDILTKQRQQLHKITGLSHDEASSRLLKLVEKDLASEVGMRIVQHERKLEETCEQRTREILLLSTQRFAASHVAESTTSTIDIPNDDMKGRIIGREGRNIRSFEKETGVDVIIDDTPGVVIVSGFDPVRREVARLALAKLIADGRIHPSRIEEVVKQTQTEIEDFIFKKGNEAAQEVDIHGLDKRIIQMLGRLHFRTSYSQNVLRHSIEVAFLAGMLAELIGFDPVEAKRCGLLHDIGKAADHEMEGGHPKIGADLLKRAGESEHVVHAALGHHDDIVSEYPYTVLVATGDACSASRPGARRESLERYIKRMEELETLAKEFGGVEQAFAIQAGREVRVIASARETDDAKAAKICRDIAKAYEERLTYPGEVKVTIIRESRFTEIAK